MTPEGLEAAKQQVSSKLLILTSTTRSSHPICSVRQHTRIIVGLLWRLAFSFSLGWTREFLDDAVGFLRLDDH